MITARCGYARKHNLHNCEQRYYKTNLWAITSDKIILPLYVPTIRCYIHPEPNVSYIYGWTDEYDKFIPGYGDEIINGVEIWTLIPFGTQPTNDRGISFRTWQKCRYHFTFPALEAFVQHFTVNSLV